MSVQLVIQVLITLRIFQKKNRSKRATDSGYSSTTHSSSRPFVCGTSARPKKIKQVLSDDCREDESEFLEPGTLNKLIQKQIINLDDFKNARAEDKMFAGNQNSVLALHQFFICDKRVSDAQVDQFYRKMLKELQVLFSDTPNFQPRKAFIEKSLGVTEDGTIEYMFIVHCDTVSCVDERFKSLIEKCYLKAQIGVLPEDIQCLTNKQPHCDKYRMYEKAALFKDCDDELGMLCDAKSLVSVLNEMTGQNFTDEEQSRLYSAFVPFKTNVTPKETKSIKKSTAPAQQFVKMPQHSMTMSPQGARMTMPQDARMTMPPQDARMTMPQDARMTMSPQGARMTMPQDARMTMSPQGAVVMMPKFKEFVFKNLADKLECGEAVIVDRQQVLTPLLTPSVLQAECALKPRSLLDHNAHLEHFNAITLPESQRNNFKDRHSLHGVMA